MNKFIYFQTMKKPAASDAFYTSPDNKQKHLLTRDQLLWVCGVVSLLLCSLIFGGFIFNRSILIIRVVERFDECYPACSGISDLDKFDCHPDDGTFQKTCAKRGCCFDTKGKTSSSLNVPWCYFPTDYDGYSISNITQDGRHIKAALRRSTASGFPNDILNLQLLITFIDDYKLRIKITDTNAQRFEVPIPINVKPQSLKKPFYDVRIDSKTGQLIIIRKSTGKVIFKTNLSQMIYSNQFLQLSSHLPSHYIYGIGEHKDSFLKSVNWTKLTLFNFDVGPIENHQLYGSQPFYLSLEENGLANGVFLLNSNAMDIILQPTPAITFRPIGGIFDFFVMLGPSPAEVVRQYTGIVGRTFMPPYWSLGFHLCRYGYKSLNKTREITERTINASIPLDVQWNDIDYMNRNKDFTYDEVKYAGLPNFVEELHNKGMHYIIMTDPGISNAEKPGTYSPFDDGLKNDVFIKNPNGSLFVGKVWTSGGTVFPDFSHPNSTDYWTNQFQNFHAKIKYDGVWIDMNEPSNFYDGEKDGCINSSFEDPVYIPGGPRPLRHKTVCMTAKHYSTIHYNEHNLYSYREAAATYHALKTIRQKRPFIISRATFAGQGTKSGHWSGDIVSNWQDMRYTIQSLLNFNLYGISMIGSDICGFGHNTTVPLCARWQSLGAFYPFSRNHNELNAIDQDPVALGPIVVEAARKSLETRYALLPHLYTLFYRSHVFGDTVIRPLFFEFPEDEKTYAIDEQFLWGSGFMIMPVLYEGNETVTAYFPKSIWYSNAWEQFNSSGQTLTLDVPITAIAFCVRGGLLFVAQIPALNTASSRNNPFLITAGLNADGKACGELFWDDGDSLDTYEEGSYTLIQFKVQNNTLTTELVENTFKNPMPLGGVRIAGLAGQPSQVFVNGTQCEEQPYENIEQKVSFISPSGIVELLKSVKSKNATCVYHFLPPVGIAVGLNGYDLHSSFTVTWKY